MQSILPAPPPPHTHTKLKASGQETEPTDHLGGSTLQAHTGSAPQKGCGLYSFKFDLMSFFAFKCWLHKNYHW